MKPVTTASSAEPTRSSSSCVKNPKPNSKTPTSPRCHSLSPPPKCRRKISTTYPAKPPRPAAASSKPTQTADLSSAQVVLRNEPNFSTPPIQKRPASLHRGGNDSRIMCFLFIKTRPFVGGMVSGCNLTQEQHLRWSTRLLLTSTPLRDGCGSSARTAASPTPGSRSATLEFQFQDRYTLYNSQV
jgi:hypothetical protein